MIMIHWVLILLPLSGAPAERSGRAQTSIPPEEVRLSPAIFREGLRQRGLIELLEQHLKEYPPASPSAAALMSREVKLAEFADRTRSLEQREAAIDQANRILEQLISENSDDIRAIEWRLTLAHSLLYQQGETYATNLLFFGGSDTDRSKLAPLTQRAIATLRQAIAHIAAENKRIDSLPAREFERADESGYVEKLDRLGPAGEYLLLWALFYDALHRDEKDSVRDQQLRQILDTFKENPNWLATPQEQSHVQLPALVLAGMAQRRLGDLSSALQYFERASEVAQLVADPAEKESIKWVEILGMLEAARTARDDGRFGDALDHLASLRADPATRAPSQYGVRLAAALLERSVLLARAQSAERVGRSPDATRFREEAWRSLATLAAEEPQNKSVLYATLFRTLGSRAQLEGTKDPIEMSAWLAGNLDQALRNDQRKTELLEQVIVDGEKYLEQSSGAHRSMAPEILFQVAIANYRLNRLDQAAEKMLEIARRFPNYGQAGEAALTAVQLAAQQCSIPAQCSTTSENHRRYRRALETLLAGHSNLEQTSYWRFFYAQLLEDAEEYPEAAAEYSRVDPDHQYYFEAAFRRVRALARAAAASTQHPSQLTERSAQVDAVATACRDLVTRFAAESPGKDPKRIQEMDDMVAQGRLLLVETYLLPGVDRAQQAVELLSDFESTFGNQSPHRGRFWQSRLRALKALGRFDEAAQMVPQYVQADPVRSGPVLQQLYSSMLSDWRQKHRDDGTSPPFESQIMLLLSQQILNWTQRDDVNASLAQRKEAAVQHAETHLYAEKFEDARVLFEKLLPPAVKDTASLDALDLRAMYGHANALLKSGHADKALPEFNRLATSLPPQEHLRWQSLLGDLEARTVLGQPAEGILRVIAQQRRLFPDLGGRENVQRFDRLERENIRRRDQQKP